MSTKFAQNLRTARTACHWSVSELARRCKEAGLSNFHPATINRTESGEREIRLNEAPVIAAVFGLVVEQMTLSAADFDAVAQYVSARERVGRVETNVRIMLSQLPGAMSAVAAVPTNTAPLSGEQLDWIRQVTGAPPAKIAGKWVEEVLGDYEW